MEINVKGKKETIASHEKEKTEKQWHHMNSATLKSEHYVTETSDISIVFSFFFNSYPSLLVFYRENLAIDHLFIPG